MGKINKFIGFISSVLLLSACYIAPSEGNAPALYKYEDIQQGGTVSGAYSQFKNINTDASFIGYGYDVINDPYLDCERINMSAPILDVEKLQNASLKLMNIQKGEFSSIKSTTMDDFSQRYNASLNVYGKYGKCFSGGLKADYHGSQEEKNFYVFNKTIYQVKSFNLYLTNSLKDIRNMLSEDFEYDLYNLSPARLFDRYGTHLIKEACMGGRVEVSTTYSSKQTTYTNDVQAAINAHIKFGAASINTELEGGYSDQFSSLGVTEETEISHYGGRQCDFSSIEKCYQNYDRWLSSFDESLEYSMLSGIPGENSLIGLWELVDNDHQERSRELENYFFTSANDSYAELCELFKLTSKRYVTINSCENGKVEGNRSPYQKGDEVTLTATPNANYKLDGWYSNNMKVCSDLEYKFIIEDDVELDVRFVGNEESKEDELPEKTETYTFSGTRSIDARTSTSYKIDFSKCAMKEYYSHGYKNIRVRYKFSVSNKNWFGVSSWLRASLSWNAKNEGINLKGYENKAGATMNCELTVEVEAENFVKNEYFALTLTSTNNDSVYGFDAHSPVLELTYIK